MLQDVTTEAEEEDRPTARRNAAITAENFSEVGGLSFCGLAYHIVPYSEVT